MERESKRAREQERECISIILWLFRVWIVDLRRGFNPSPRRQLLVQSLLLVMGKKRVTQRETVFDLWARLDKVSTSRREATKKSVPAGRKERDLCHME